MTTNVAWSIEGPHFVNCNWDYGCPWQFNALPKDGYCRAAVAWRIDRGHFGDVKLDGLRAVNLYSWPGPIHKGGGDDAAERRAGGSGPCRGVAPPGAARRRHCRGVYFFSTKRRTSWHFLC
jgi:hypothetical protein